VAFTTEQLETFKASLLEERRRIEEDRVAYAKESGDDPQHEADGDLSDSDPDNSADEASNLFDRDRDLAAVENATRLLSKIDRALEKIEDGTYGLSDIDGTPIPVERLEAIPYAVTTVEQEEAN